MSNQPITIALAGNPNCGKTAIFNALTGNRQRVGNWPGVTVDKKSGYLQHKNQHIEVIDLPGIYSSSVSSDSAIDEKITCEHLLSGEADIIVNVIDASNLERHLYLTLQLREMRIPMIVVLNMMDLVKQRGIVLDTEELSGLLDCPVVEMIARKNKGMTALKDAISSIKTDCTLPKLQLTLPKQVEHAIKRIRQTLPAQAGYGMWLAQRLVEQDHFAMTQVTENIRTQVQTEIKKIEAALENETDILIPDARYRLSNEITEKISQQVKTPRQSITKIIDSIVLNRILGIPIFFGVMYLMFLFAINVGGAFQDFFDIGSSTIFVDGAAHLLTQWHFPSWLIALLANGIGTGINTTITFAPVIGGMFLFLTFLEDSGYMTRAAFVMDRFMRSLGLPGQSFVPMIVGFGCNVPAVMGSRTLSNRRDRILSVMMMPFISCGARLAIFAVFASAFFPKGGALIIFMLYLLGVFVAVLTGFLLRNTILKGKTSPLIMELPAYHIPQVSSLLRHMWQRLKGFLFRAGRYIIPICVLIGGLNAVSFTGQLTRGNHAERSALATVGRTITPILSPLGVKKDNWPATVGLATGILAKEVVVGTLNTLYSEKAHFITHNDNFNFWGGLKAAVYSIPENLSQLSSAFANPIAADEAPHDINKTAFGELFKEFGSKSAAFSYLLFVLLYFPCVSTMAAMRREIGKRWMLFSVFWSTGLAYGLAVMCYQLLTVKQHVIQTVIAETVLTIAFITVIIALRCYAKRGPRPPTANHNQKTVVEIPLKFKSSGPSKV